MWRTSNPALHPKTTAKALRHCPHYKAVRAITKNRVQVDKLNLQIVLLESSKIVLSLTTTNIKRLSRLDDLEVSLAMQQLSQQQINQKSQLNMEK